METFCFFREVQVNGRRFFLAHTVPDKSKMLDFISAGSGPGRGPQAVGGCCEGQKSGPGKIEPEYEACFLWSIPEYEKI